jgi:hypothetical protein
MPCTFSIVFSEVEERRDLDEAADRDHEERADQKQDVALRSKILCLSRRRMVVRSLFGRLVGAAGGSTRMGLASLIAEDCHPDVEGHDQRAQRGTARRPTARST